MHKNLRYGHIKLSLSLCLWTPNITTARWHVPYMQAVLTGRVSSEGGIALVISKLLSSNVTDQQVESSGHVAILDGSLAWIHRFFNQRARHFAAHLDIVHSPSTCGLPQASLAVRIAKFICWLFLGSCVDLWSLFVIIFDNRSPCLWSRHETDGSWKQALRSFL
jgi:hypothetical protein